MAARHKPSPIPGHLRKKILPPLSAAVKAEREAFEAEREQKRQEENRKKAEKAYEEEKGQPKLRDELHWDVRCLVYQHLDYATLAELAEHSVFPELQKCLREVVLNSASEDEEGYYSQITIRLDFLEQFPHLTKLSGPTINDEDEDKQGQEWGTIEINDFLTKKDVKFILGLNELAYVEFNIAVETQGEDEYDWETSEERKLLLGLLAKSADKFNFRIKLSVKETGEEHIWARYDGGIEFYSSVKSAAEIMLSPLIPFEMRWYMHDIDVEGRKRVPAIKQHNLLAMLAPDFVIGISKEYQAEHGRKRALELQRELVKKHPTHEVILEEWK